MIESSSEDDMPELEVVGTPSSRMPPATTAQSTLRELGLPEAQVQLALLHCDGTAADAIEQAFSLSEPAGGWESITAAALAEMVQQLQARNQAAPSDRDGTPFGRVIFASQSAAHSNAESTLRELGLPEAQIQLALLHCNGV